MKKLPRRSLIGFGVAAVAQIVLFGRKVFASTAIQEVKPNGASENRYSQLVAEISRLSLKISRTPPIGSISAYAGPLSAIPDGWLACDGRPLSRDGEFKELFDSIGSAWGTGRGLNSFSLPDLGGRFLRGVDDSPAGDRDLDRANRVACRDGGNIGNKVGTLQSDAIVEHAHDVLESPHTHDNTADCSWYGNGGGALRFMIPLHPGGVNNTSRPLDNPGKPGQYVHLIEPNITGIKIKSTGGKETHPRNASVYWIIRVKY